MSPEQERRLQAGLPRLRLFWVAMPAASLACAGLGILAAPLATPTGAGSMPPAAAVVAFLGALSSAMVILLDRAILAPARVAARIRLPDADLALRYLLAGHLAIWSLAGLPGILGFAHLLLGGPLRIHLALCAVSLCLLALLAPAERRIRTRVEAVLEPPSGRRGQRGRRED